jgi:site-specific DNA recombinase
MRERGAIYSRISDDREGLEHGVIQQEADCHKRAKRDGVPIPDHHVYRENDRGASSKSKKARPQYKAMLKAIEAGEITVVYAYSNSRLTRRLLELEDLIKLHERTGVQFRTVVSGDDNLSTADGRMVARIKAAVDAAEAERNSERVTRRSEARAREGRGHGGQRPYGWQAEDRRKLDPKEHKVIKEAVKRVFQGDSLRSIAADFNKRGIPTVTGVPWSISGLRALLVNPRLAGIRVYQGKQIGKGDWKPAITELEHRRLDRILTASDRRTASDNRRKYRMTGLAICAECQVPVVLRINSEKGRPSRQFYGCKVCGMIRKREWVDAYTDGVMEEFLRGYEPKPPIPADVRAAREAERLRARIEDTKATFAESDVITPADLEKMLRTLYVKLQAAEDKATPPSVDAVLDGVTGEDPKVPWGEIPVERQRRIIDLFFTVELSRGRPGIRTFDPETVRFVPKA